MRDTQKAKAEQLDRILSAADQLLGACTEVSCIGTQGVVIRAKLLTIAQDLVLLGSRIVSSDEGALHDYESRLGILARRIGEASR